MSVFKTLIFVALLLSPSTASAQFLWWTEDGNSFTSFGPGQTVRIYEGKGVANTCDFVIPATDIYVVNVSSLSDQAPIIDVSNSAGPGGTGLPNTTRLGFGGLMVDDLTLGFTQPGGFIGAGTYGVVYDECQDGKFDVGEDTLFYPAFTVVIPANIPALPNAAFQAIKTAAGEEGDSWAFLLKAVEAVELLIKFKETLECLSGGIAGCLASMAIDAVNQFLIENAMAAFGLKDPKDAAKDAVLDTISHYGGIHADPPDPNFSQLDALQPVTQIPQTSSDPLIKEIIAVGNAQGTQAALLEALLHAIERYQGADNAGNANWALEHARSIQALSNTLRSQLPDSTAALTALDAALTADPRDLNQGVQAAPLIAQIIINGFQPSQLQALLNAGLPQNQVAALRADVAAYPWIGVSEAEMHTSIADVLADHAALDSALASLSTSMSSVITTLLAPPNVTSGHPLADAGGPYAGDEGVAVALNGSVSSDPGGSIMAYHWDLDRDGQFDDATGATPSFVFPAAFNGLIGLRVLDNSGNASIDYAHVAIADTNLPPVIDSVAPVDRTLTLPVGDSQAFSVVATDPDGDTLTVRWLVDFVEVAIGQGTSHQQTFNIVGTRNVRVEVSDGTAAGGMIAEEWMVTAEAPDADGDGWRANADCNDANPAINPGAAEIIGNGIDDDCRAETLDGGSPPIASFTVAPGVKPVGQPVAFTDTSSDSDGPLVSWAWNFGDGETSSQQHPSHVFATAGGFQVVLTVTDGQGLSATTSQSVTATNLPTASFTSAPSPGVRNTPIQFTDTSTDPDGPIASRSWVFGDGGISSDTNPIHTFTSAGTFTVTLTVTDGHGATATASQAVVVNPALTDTTAVSFKIRHGCSTAMSYQFKIGGVLAGTLPPFTQANCNSGTPVEQTLTVTDPAVLALVTAPVCQVFTLQSTGTGTSAIGWSRVEIGRPGGTEIVRIMNTNQYDGPTAYSAFAGFTGASGGPRTFNSVLPNKDGDATPDCSDTDIDGDTKLNGADNCPLISNLNQADSDGNGIGDACQDIDADTILDSADNCPLVANTNQFNFDNDATGNACDNDIDGDSVDNTIDNCQYISNADQANTNGDAFGNACDVAQLRFVVEGVNQQYDRTWTMSIDGKTVGTMPSTTVPNTLCTTPPVVMTITDPEKLGLLGAVPTCNNFRMVSDNRTYLTWAKAEIQMRSGVVNPIVIHATTANSFPTNSACQTLSNTPPTYNFTPLDSDKDSIYDCEDPDTDGDGVANNVDNCPTVSNANQADIDGNGIGNACQDTDNDGDLDIADNCPTVANADQANLDGDPLGDLCDPDDDNDTVADAVDNCPRNANTNQSNIDGDAVGDVCDTDIDNDGDLNSADNCPTLSNADQRNTDGDSLGDVCDPDLDNDGVANTIDNCLYVANASQQSTNPYKTGDACIVAPITVPWLGVHTQPHQVFSGGTLVLQGVAVYQDTFLPADILSASWDPGDGSPAKPVVNVSDPRVLEVSHTYTGAVNTPYIAKLTITMLNGATRSDEFRVIIQPKTLDVEANMAIDRGLWNLHKLMISTTVGTAPNTIAAGRWTGSNDAAATSATMQAFGINNHREVGNPLEDPYVVDVKRGMRFIENALTPLTIGLQNGNNPDTNGNTIGLQYTGSPIYVTGHIADAFVAMGTPNAIAVGGHATRVKGRTYRDLVQDMMDMYWWGQTESGTARGGWRYSWNSGADHSTAQWAAIAGLAGFNAWNIPIPAFVKTENLIWIKASQDVSTGTARGRLGYTGTTCQASNCMSTTPSGMIQMIFDGVRNDPAVTSGIAADPTDEERFQLGIKYLAKGMRNAWHTSEYPSAANYYSLFAMAKAFRLAIDTDGSGNVVPDPVVMIDDVAGGDPPFDWYRNDPVTPSAAQPRGVARLLISKQAAGGEWPAAGHWPGSLATAYAVIVLSPTIFELGPAAACTATPSIAGAGDVVQFDGSLSVHNDPFGTITNYRWDFVDGSAPVTNAAPNATATHTFTALGTFNVVLTVTDSNGLTATSSCPVTVIDGNRPPIANAGGPYNFCAGSPMMLYASSSIDPDGDPLTYSWDLTNPLNFVNAEGSTAEFNAAGNFPGSLSSLPPGTYQIGLRVSDNHAHSTAIFPNIAIHAADNPLFCNTPPELTLPANIVTPATGPGGAMVEFEVIATDAHDDDLTPVCTPASGTIFEIDVTTVTCSVKDSGGLSDTGSFTVTVTNNAPQFTPPANITVFASSAAGATVQFTAVGTDIESGEIPAVCVPASGSIFAIGSKLVSCTVSDGHLIAPGSFTVIVRNNPPTFTPPPDVTVAATSPAGAVVMFVAEGSDVEDGTIPAACTRPSGDTFALGTTTVLCSVKDNHGETVSKNFTITVINSPPVAGDDVLSTAEDTPLNASVAGGDTDVEGDALSFFDATNPAHGSVVLQPNGSFVYTPAANYCGPDAFTYQVSDGIAGSDTGLVSITVTCVNDPPVAVDDANATNEDTPVDGSVAGGDTDIENDSLSFANASDPAHGSVTLQPDGAYTYTPDANYCGVDTFTYQVNDGNGGSDSGAVTITVACVNDAPVAVDDANATNEDTPVDGSVAGGDADAEGDPLSFSDASDPAHGSVTLQANGLYTYTPDPNYCGPDTFTYQVNDNRGGSDAGLVAITVVCVNDAPLAGDDVNATNEDTPVDGSVAGGDTDIEDDSLSFADASDPVHGSVTLQPNGSYTYIPDANYCGTDTFTYQVHDGNGGSDTGEVMITVACINDPPVAADDANATNEDTPVDGSVAGGDADGEGDALSFSNASDPANGSVTLLADGSYTYTPDGNYCGIDTFTYQVNDTNGGSDSGLVTITVACINDPPVAVDDANATNEDTPVDGSVAGGDADIEGDSLSFADASDPVHGSVTLQPNGSYTYTPDANYCGTDTFTYQVRDGNGGSDTGEVTITVTCVNDPPVAGDDANATNEDTPVAGSVAGGDADGEGDALSFSNASDPAHGSVTLQENGSYTYTPDANYCGIDTFTYQVNDSHGGSDTGLVTITVACINDAPVAGDDANATNEDTPVNGTVAGGDTDIDGDSLSFSNASDPAHGSVTLQLNGSYTYTPDANYCGGDTFTYQVNDGNGASDTALVTITVACVNDAPVAGDDANTTKEDTAVAGSVAGGDSDIDGDSLSFSDASDPAHGSVTLQLNGSYLYTPDPAYCGTDTFTYQVNDGKGGSDTGLVTISVTCGNAPPVAADGTLTTTEDSPLAGVVSSTDSDGPSATYSLVSGPSQGTLVLTPATGAFTYTPAANYNGSDSFRFSVSDGAGGTDTGDVSITVTPVNDLPVCTVAGPSVASLWPPNHQLVDINVLGVTDPVEGGAITIRVTGIFQDEPTNTIGDGNTSTDGYGVGTPVARLRAERSGSKRVPGDGRMYYINFTGTDAQGGQCEGTVRVGVPHDLGQDHVIGAGGPLYNSVTGARQQ